MKYRLIIGGIIAYILLMLYSGIMIYLIIRVLKCTDHHNCIIVISDGITYVLTTVGGLVSALVISKLSITTPGKDPAVFNHLNEKATPLLRIVTWCYLLLWTLIGLAALIVGVLIYPGLCKTVSDIGTTWLGTGVAAGWAYFGLDPSRDKI